MPDQIKRLLVIFVVVVAGFIAAKIILTPKDFGKYGHYRPSAVDSIMALPIHYAGHKACVDCHDDIDAKKKESFHKGVNCESCHGPCEEHIQSSGDVKPFIPRGRDYCILCHEYNPARPTGFPQIDPITHNSMQACITCHNPHAPDPKRTPGDCSACHASIARTKALSPHAPLACTDCHVTPDEHKVDPRAHKPSKPTTRADCGKCHAKDAPSRPDIPRVDIDRHREGYLCWQCHYPHFPEVQNNEKE